MTWRAIVRSILPDPIRQLVRWKLQHSFRYKRHRESASDYLAEFDHKSLRKAKASILWFEDWNRATLNHVRILQELGLVSRDDLIVDFGCGIGRMSQALAEKGAKLLAVDRSTEMRNHAKKYISKKFLDEGTVLLLSDSEFLSRVPDLERSVDTVLFMEVLQHIPEPVIDDLLPQILHVLKPGGRIVVFGNEKLDVGADGRVFPNTPSIDSVLLKHTHIVRRDTWPEGFSALRFSFVCSAPDPA